MEQLILSQQDAVQADIQPIKYMIFSGGAAKGFGHLGILRVFNTLVESFGSGKPLLDTLEGFGGTSFGSIIALACSLGLDLDVVVNFFLEMDMKSVLLRNVDLASLMVNKAFLHNDDFISIIEGLIRQRVGNIDSSAMTFSYLRRKTGRILKVVVSNITDETYEIWDSDSTPDIPVALAIVASCAIPLIFPPVALNGKLYVDGGMYYNFPIDIFPAKETIGVRFSATQQRRIDPRTFAHTSFIQYISHVLTSGACYHEQRYFLDCLECYSDYSGGRIITIAVDQDMLSVADMISPSRERKEQLVQIGEAHAIAAFVKHTQLGSKLEALCCLLGGTFAFVVATAATLPSSTTSTGTPAHVK